MAATQKCECKLCLLRYQNISIYRHINISSSLLAKMLCFHISFFFLTSHHGSLLEARMLSCSKKRITSLQLLRHQDACHVHPCIHLLRPVSAFHAARCNFLMGITNLFSKQRVLYTRQKQMGRQMTYKTLFTQALFVYPLDYIIQLK